MMDGRRKIMTALQDLLSEKDYGKLCHLLNVDAKKIVEDHLRPRLKILLATEENQAEKSYSAATYDRIYNTLLLLARYWPLNAMEQSDALDVLTRCPIPEEKRICLSTGHQRDLDELMRELHHAEFKNINLDTQTVFDARDLLRIHALAMLFPEHHAVVDSIWDGCATAVGYLAFPLFILPGFFIVDYPIVMMTGPVAFVVIGGIFSLLTRLVTDTNQSLESLILQQEEVLQAEKAAQFDKIPLGLFLNDPQEPQHHRVRRWRSVSAMGIPVTPNRYALLQGAAPSRRDQEIEPEWRPANRKY